MSEENNTFNNAASSGSNDNANQENSGHFDYITGSSKTNHRDHDDAAIQNGNPANGKESSADSAMTSMDEEKPSEFDSLRDDEAMAMMNSHSGTNDHENKNADQIHNNEYFAVAYSGDTDEMMESNLNDSSSHRHYDGDNEKDFDNFSVASQAASESEDFNYSDEHFHTAGTTKFRIECSSPPKEDATWFGKSKTTASTASTPQASNTTNDEEGRERKAERIRHKDSGGIQAASSDSANIMKEISCKLDEKLENTRGLTKRLLQAMTAYVQSLQTVAIEYQRIRESELRESQRLDAVEPEVNGASGMLLGDRVFLDQQNQLPTSEGRHRRHSSPKKERRPMRPRRDRPLTPINRRGGKIPRDGKENSASHQLSFD